MEEVRKSESDIYSEKVIDSSQKFSGTTYTNTTVVLGTAMVRVCDVIRELQPV